LEGVPMATQVEAIVPSSIPLGLILRPLGRSLYNAS